MDSSTDKRPRSPLRIVASGAAVVLLFVSAQSQAMPCKVEMQRGVMMITAQESARASCIEAIAQRTGLKVSGLADVHGTVTLELSTPVMGEAIRRLAGDASYTLVEMADGPASQSLSFTGEGVAEKASRAVMTADSLTGAVVENFDTGFTEVQASPGPASAVKADARPDAPGASPVHVTMED